MYACVYAGRMFGVDNVASKEFSKHSSASMQCIIDHKPKLISCMKIKLSFQCNSIFKAFEGKRLSIHSILMPLF